MTTNLQTQLAEAQANARAWQPISELTRGIKGEVLFIERIAGDSVIEDTFAGTYCATGEHNPEWLDCFVNPSANAIEFNYIKRNYTHFYVFTPADVQEGE